MTVIRRLTFPLSPTLLGTGGVLVLIAAMGSSREAADGLAVVWVTVSTSVREGLFLAGPVAGLTAMMIASRFNTARSIILPVSAVRAGAVSVRRHMTVLGIVAGVALTLGQISGFVAAVQRATDGGPDLLVIASAYPVLAAYIAIGYLVGTTLPGWKAGVVGAILLGSMSLFGGMTGSRWWSVAPVWTYGLTRAGFHDSLPLTLFRLFFFSLVALAAGVTSAKMVTLRSMPTRRRIGLTARNLAPILLIALAAGARPPAIQYRDLAPETECDAVSQTKVCVHAAHADLLPTLLAISGQAIETAGPGLTHDLLEISDESILPLSDLHRASVVLNLSNDSEFSDFAAVQIARWLARVDVCEPDAARTISDSQQINEGIQLWIYRQIGLNASDAGYFADEGITVVVADRLARMTQADTEQWISRNLDGIKSCTATPADVP